MIAKFVKRCVILSSLPLLSSVAYASSEAPLLKGHINASESKEIAIAYEWQGDVYDSTVTTDASGNFVYDAQLATPETDVIMLIDGKPYGAYIRQGSTTEMSIGDTVKFSRDNVPESRFYNTYQQEFSPLKFKLLPDEKFVYADRLKKLQDGRDRALSDASVLPGGWRERAERLVSAKYDMVHIMLLTANAAETGVDSTAVVNDIVARIDPNADESRLTGIINYWYNNAGLNGDMSSMLAFVKSMFAAIDKALTNEGNKKNLYYSLGSMFMSDQPSDEVVAELYAAIEPQLSKAPMVKQRMENMRESMRVKVKDGDAVPTDPIVIAPDGTKSKLSDILAQKKVIYIDIWATWCGPCCREIPYMEKLVERFKGNDKIMFVSISRDDDHDAWLRKLDRDKPTWEQYVFDKTSGDRFMEAMTIRGIPRFLIIGPDGRFISTNAKRPSDETIDSTLNAAIDSSR